MHERLCACVNECQCTQNNIITFPHSLYEGGDEYVCDKLQAIFYTGIADTRRALRDDRLVGLSVSM